MIPILRSNDYFGQYGKISKILLHKRTPPGSSDPIVGIYINYQRREDAARAIEKIDGSASPSADGEVMHASFGTAKYCINFLRSVNCTNTGCLDVHEWGDERDCFTRQDLVSMYVRIYTVYPTTHRSRAESISTRRPRSALQQVLPSFANQTKVGEWLVFRSDTYSMNM